LSLVGFPPTAGFLAKFYIFSAGVNNGLTWLVVVALLNTVISAYFYLRVVKVMWLGEPTTEGAVPSSWSLRFSLAISSLGVLVLGIFPAFALNMADLAARMFIF